ncbi:TetR/AcrR family transcriptional regulator [Catellatospora tritici]|uniref:TetR/AcrR family transcriptional regulator n=1 Tax=Catellatospora tritici TaxID=2851566 RepID=UPI001C2CF9B9|nr:TetR/AcrR family transcriptional regulator [Catellatospora tritici]MBV1849000.1 TetR/AcrR family transcriptional regulator [Catellatospora tritici]
MELDSAALPPNIAAAWGLRERPGKGPKPGLSVDRIVAAGIRVAMAEGIGAVSMSKVAAEAGVSTMALYRYVRAKNELLELMVDACIGEPPPHDPGLDWRAGLTAWAWAVRTVYLANAWALKAPISGPPATPHQLAWLDAGLRHLTDTGLTEARKMSVLLLLTGYVRNEAMLTADIAAATEAASSSLDDAIAMYGRMLRVLVDPVRFPALGRVVEAGVLEQADDPAEEFVFGLERILDGVGILIAART